MMFGCCENLLFLIYVVRVEQRVGMLYPSILFPPDIEAAPVSCMASGGPVLFDLDHNGIGVTVRQDFNHILGVAGLFSLHPVFVAAATVKPGLPIAQGVVQGGFIHKGNHQDFTTFMVLDDSGNQAAHFVKINFYHDTTSEEICENLQFHPATVNTLKTNPFDFSIE